jgi:hypothetical protein
MSPFLLRRSHTCDRCGWVSERPARVFAVYCGFIGLLLVTFEPWALRVLVAMLGVLCVQLAQNARVESARGERAGELGQSSVREAK